MNYNVMIPALQHINNGLYGYKSLTVTSERVLLMFCFQAGTSHSQCIAESQPEAPDYIHSKRLQTLLPVMAGTN